MIITIKVVPEAIDVKKIGLDKAELKTTSEAEIKIEGHITDLFNLIKKAAGK